MRTRIFTALLTCLLLAGCHAPLAFPPEATPGEAPAPAAPAATEPLLPPQEPGAGRSFPFAALEGDIAYWCTGSGVLAMQAGAKARLFSPARGRLPAVMGEYLYMIEDETDVAGDAGWPVPADAVVASSILRIPLAGGDAEKIYTAPASINSFAALDSRLYLSTSDGEALQDAGGLFSLDAEGTDERLLAEDCILISALQEDYAYYMGVLEARSALLRIPLAGGEGEVLLEGKGWPITPLAYRGDVYYIHMDLMNAEGANNLTILRLRENKSEVVGQGFTAHELLGIWDGKLYYTVPTGNETDASFLAGQNFALVRLDLATLDSETLRKGVTQFAALSGAYALYSDTASVFSATDLKLQALPGGEPIAMNLEDAVESQG